MELTEPFYAGSPITIKLLRDFILDNGLTDNDTILLHPINFRELAHDYDLTYKESLEAPYLLIRVLVKEDTQGLVRKDRIVTMLNDTESQRSLSDPESTIYPVVYRCGWCGNIVDADGSKLLDVDWMKREQQLGSYKVAVRNVNGYCCPNEYQPVPTRSVV